MGSLAYQVTVLVHLLSDITWVGGTLFLVMVLVPLVRSRGGTPSERALLLGQTARRFRSISWVSVALLVLTGVYLASQRWGIGFEEFINGDGWFVSVLQIKVGLVGVIIVLSAVHDFFVGPRLNAAMEGITSVNELPTNVTSYRKAVVWLARVNVLLVLVVLILAVTLTRGSFL